MTSAPQIPRAQWAALVALASVGVLVVLSAGATPAAERHGAPWFHALRHAAAALAAGSLGWVVARQRERNVEWGWPVAGALAVALVVTLVPPLGLRSGGASRAIGAFGFGLQPSILLAALAPTVGSIWLTQGRAVWWASAMLGACVVCALQPNFAHLGLLLAIAACSAAGAGRWRIAGGAVSLGVVSGLLALCYPYVRWRVASYLSAGLTADTQALAGNLPEVSWWGSGLGQGSWKTLLSAAPSDYAFAVALEELGAVGALAVVVLLGCAVLSLNLRRPPGPERARVWGTAAFFMVPAILHAGVSLRVIPVTGVHFPLLSADVSATLAVGLALGLCAERARSVSRVSVQGDRELGLQFRGLRASVRWSRAFHLEWRNAPPRVGS